MEKENKQKMPTCWAEVRFDGSTNFEQLISLLNNFNQRLAVLEDATYIKDEDGTMKTVTKIYQEQAEAQMKAAAEAAEAQNNAQAEEKVN